MTGVGGITLGLKMWSAVGSFFLLSPNYLDIMQATGASIGCGKGYTIALLNNILTVPGSILSNGNLSPLK